MSEDTYRPTPRPRHRDLSGAGVAQTIVYKARRYDVTDWVDRHPGGPVIKDFLGQDVTCAFHMLHDMRNPIFLRLLEGMDIGPADDHPISDFDRDYLDLEQVFLDRGWFEVNYGWYAREVGVVLGLLVVAYIATGPILSGLFFGLFIHQAAFLAHDVAHDSVVPARWRRRASWLFGSVCFGISHEKWTREHNEHHLEANRPVSDPQMNSMPHLVYSRREIDDFERTRRPLTNWEKMKLATQHIWVLPVLLLYGRINIVSGDLRRAVSERDAHHLSAFAIHMLLWATLLWLGWRGLDTAVSASSIAAGAAYTAWFTLATLVISGSIHLQLILSHAYAPRLYKEEQEAMGMKFQALSNQNISTSLLDDWFHGGLQHHVEHHLFPRMPRHNLAKIRPYLRELCEKHGIEYKSDSFFRCILTMLKSLASASSGVRKDLRTRYLPG